MPRTVTVIRIAGVALVIALVAAGFPSASAAPVPDGSVSPGEYDSTLTLGGGALTVHWSIVGQEAFFAIVGSTSGWVAIGIEPSRAMKDADMIFGWVDGGRASMLDAFSTGNYGPHPPDTDLGGTSDILAFEGSEQGGTTTIEFKRLLSTGDAYDKVIPVDGNIKIIWAMGSNDNYLNAHVNNRGEGVLTMAVPEGSAIMALGFLAALAARSRRWDGC